MKRSIGRASAFLLAGASLVGALSFTGSAGAAPTQKSGGVTLCDPTCHGQPLRQAARKADIVIGTAVRPQILDDPLAAEILAREFSSVTAENEMKWGSIHPAPGVWNFEPADRLVAFAEEHNMEVKGHTFLWHTGSGSPPRWVRDITDPDQLRAVIEDHMRVIMTRYKGKVDRWDVVNEPFTAGTGNLNTSSHFYRVLGPDYIAWAFETARSIDPDAELVLNEALVEYVEPTRNALIALATDLDNRGLIDAVGLQMHLFLGKPVPGVVGGLVQTLSDLDLDVALTELDAQSPPIFYLTGPPPANTDPLLYQAEQYDQVVREFLAAGGDDITVWGFLDRYHFQGAGLQATLYDVNYEPKPAVKALRDALRDHAKTVKKDKAA